MKKMIIGVFIGAMLMIPLSAHGEVINLINQVVQGIFPVTVDGKSVGNAIVVDNTTYLPVRDFGEATGYTVTFTDAKEVVMTKKDSSTSTPTPTSGSPSTDLNNNPNYIRGQKIVEMQKRQSDITKELEPLYNEYKKYDRKKMDNPSTFTEEDTLQAAKKAWENKQAELEDVDKQIEALKAQQ